MLACLDTATEIAQSSYHLYSKALYLLNFVGLVPHKMCYHSLNSLVQITCHQNLMFANQYKKHTGPTGVWFGTHNSSSLKACFVIDQKD